MKAGEKLRLETLRMMKSKILNVNARGDLPEADIIRILKNYAKSLKETIDIMAGAGKTEEADKTRKELEIVSGYLPRMLSEDDTRALVKDTITALGATSRKQMGQVMKEITGKRPDADAALVSKIASELLQ